MPPSADLSLVTQLRARETLRFAPLPARVRRSTSRRELVDGLTPASRFASSIRSRSSHFQHLLLGHTGCVNAVAISPDSGRFIATGGDDLRVLLWDAYAPIKAVFPASSGVHESQSLDAPPSAAAIRSTRRVPCAGYIARAFTQSYSGHSANIFGITFSPDGARLLSCGLDAQIHCYDVSTGGGDSRTPSSRSFRGHQSSVHKLAFQAGSSDVFLSASNDHTVRLWDLRTGNAAQFVGGLAYALDSVATSPVDPYTFVTAGRGLCMHDVRRMTPTAHNVDMAQAAHATAPRRTRAQNRMHAFARELAERTRYVLDGDDDGGAADSDADQDGPTRSEEDEDLIEFIMTGGSGARPLASVMQFDISTQLPAPPALPPTPAPRRSERTIAAKVAAAATAAAASVAAARTRTRSRGRGRGAAEARSLSRSRAPEASEDHSENEPEEDVAPTARGARARGGRGRGGRGRGGRGRGGRASSSSDVEDLDLSAEDSDAATSASAFPTPNERRASRFAARMPQLDASSVEFSADGRSLAVCMMEGKPLVFDLGRKDPVLRLESVNSFAGYSNTCTMKSVVFAGPEDRFVVGGADNFGIYVWDRQRVDQDVLASPQTNPVNTATYINACQVIRGHRSVPNNQRYHPHLRQILSCGVEKVVRAFHIDRDAAHIPNTDDENEAAEGSAAGLEDGDIIDRPSSRPQSQSSSTPMSADRKRKLPSTASNDDDDLLQAEEKKSRSQAGDDDDRESKGEVEDAEMKMSDASPEAASAQASSRPRRRAAIAADAALTARAAPRRRSARHRTPSPHEADHAASSSSASASAPAAVPSLPLDPLYRMVRTYSQPRTPFTRLQCAYVLSGGSDWAFGAAASMFADGLEEEQTNDNDADDMAEDRQCMAQFDWYFHKSAAGERDSDDDDDDEDDEEEDGDDDDDDDDTASSISAADGGDPPTVIELDDHQMARLRDALLHSMPPQTQEDGESESD